MPEMMPEIVAETPVVVDTVTLAHNISPLRAEIMRLEGERVFVWNDWVIVLSLLALYNARATWGDVIRRMNEARRRAMAVVWR